MDLASTTRELKIGPGGKSVWYPKVCASLTLLHSERPDKTFMKFWPF